MSNFPCRYGAFQGGKIYDFECKDGSDINVEFTIELIKKIHYDGPIDGPQDKGAILVFLPGWVNISAIASRYVLITCFHEFFTCIWVFFDRKNYLFNRNNSNMAIYHLFWFLNENPFRKDPNKRHISWEKFRFRRFRIRGNM